MIAAPPLPEVGRGFFLISPRRPRAAAKSVWPPPPMPAAAATLPAARPSSPLGEADPFAGVDFLTEMKLRTWARQHHCNAGARHPDWHPVILDEMERVDREPVA